MKNTTITINPKIFILGFIILIITFVTYKSYIKYKELKGYGNNSVLLYSVINEKTDKDKLIAVYSGENLPPDTNNKGNVKYTKVNYRVGTSKYGDVHIEEQHSPVSYLTKPKPNNKTCFLRPERWYRQELLNRFLKSKDIKLLKSNYVDKKYSVYETTLKLEKNIKRTYRLVIEKDNGNVTTFYPINDVPHSITSSKQEYLIYDKVIYK